MNERRILFVDDSPEFLAVIRELMLSWSEGTWDILVAEGAGPALALLEHQPVDLVVVDVQMPVIDGIQFLQLLRRKYPSIPRTALTGHCTEETRAACLSNGAEICLEKPATSEGMHQLYLALNELARPHTEHGFQGVLRRVGLPDVLQMECLAANSSVLEVTAGPLYGEIFIRSGHVIHAQAGEVKGEEAVFKLLALKGGQFALRPFSDPGEETIEGSWQFLLMESARKVDEAQGEPEPEEVPPPPPPPPPPKRTALGPSMTSYLPGEEAAPAPVDRPPPTRIDEVVLCSSQGEVLYEWQCTGTEARINLLEFLSQKAWQIKNSLPVGQFDRVEIQAEHSRTVVLVQNDRTFLVRSSPPEVPAA